MEHFPLTDKANLGGRECGKTFDQWVCRIDFDPKNTCLREHVPDFVKLEQARLTVAGEPGAYEVVFPRKRWTLQVKDARQDIDVSDAIAVGRHSYRIVAPEGANFTATLRVSVRRPLVETRDEGYVISHDAMKYSHRHWLEDDRAAQRVGRFGLYLKTIPQHYEDTDILATCCLNGAWKYKKVDRHSIEDFSVPHADDSAWPEIAVPHTWDGDLAGWEGMVWYRKRVEVPACWEKSSVVARFEGIDDEPIVFVNGQQVGYSCGWHRSFQIDVGEHLLYGRENLIAVLLRCARRPGAGGGVTYGFVRDCSIVNYPDREEPVGGIYGRRNQLSAVRHFGSVIFEPRLYPKFEGLLRIRFAAVEDGKRHCLTMTRGSELIYRPPKIEYRGLGFGDHEGGSLEAAAGYQRDAICFTGDLGVGGCEVEAVVEAFPFKFGEPVEVRPGPEAVELVGSETGFRVLLATPTQARDGDVTVETIDEGADYRNRHIIRIKLRTDQTGGFGFALASGENARADLDWATSQEAPVAAIADRWEREVYGYALPRKMSSDFSASLRTCKQALVLCSQVLPDRPSGMLTDPLKYPIFWLRDAAISIPGALYSGRLPYEAALATAGRIFEIATEHISITVVRPDGTLRKKKGEYGQQTSSDSSQLAIYAIYKAWCQTGDEWLRQYYPTVKAYLAYSNELEQMFDNDADGIVRSSDGDWFDFAFKGKYEREGASLFVNVAYLRAMKYAAQMATAVGDDESAQRWAKLYRSGIGLLPRPVSEGGLLLADRGYLADTIQTIGDEHPNGWNYPRDLGTVTVQGGFRPIPHCVAIHEGILADSRIVSKVVESIDEFDMIRPYPALVLFPWADYMSVQGQSGPYEATEFGKRWKCLPGCHAAGGRWAFAGGLIQLGLWAADAEDLAREAKANQAGYLRLARQPARIFEDAHYSGLFRSEAGDPKDTEGYYYNWGAATPIQAMVEGEYGLEAIPEGVRIDPRHCRVGDGISKVAIAGGTAGYTRTGKASYEICLDTDRAGRLVFVAPGQADARQTQVAFDGRGNIETQVDGEEILVKYPAGALRIEVNLGGIAES